VHLPIEYLIEHLEDSKRKRLIYIMGFQSQQCSEMSSNVANKFNFKLIDVAALLKCKDIGTVADDKVNQTFKEAMAKVESVYKGVVVSGYPNNLIQANFMQQNAFLPERVFMLPFDGEQMENYYVGNGHTAAEAKLLVVRDQLNLKELKEVLKELPDWLPVDTDRQTDIVNTTLKVRDKKVTPLEAPRILVLHPPYLRPFAIEGICERYCLNLVTLESSFLKLKNRKQDYEKYVRKNEYLSN
jgi:adenylate kinase